VLLKYSTNDDALYAELSESVKTTLNNANTTGNLINKNSEAIDANKTSIEANKAEFNTYKEEHATEFSTYQETIGDYSYKENEVESSGYFEQVQNHIDAVSVSLNNEAQTRGQNDAALDERIDGISTDLSTLNSYVESIYKPAEGEESASGVLQTEINNRIAADAALNVLVEANTNAINTINTTTITGINTKIDNLYKIESVEGQDSSTISGVIHEDIVAVQNDLNTKHEALVAEDVRLAALIANEASARETADNTLHSTITREREAEEANLLNKIHNIYRIETKDSEIEGE
jgi:hypothetical protein